MLVALLAMTALPAADPLIDLRSEIPDLVLDIRYASADNIAGRALYPFSGAFLRRSSAAKLARAARTLRAEGLRLVIYDAYRPLSAQKALWAARPDPRWVADPVRGSSHNKGGAVDAGLADLEGRPVPMPSRFDEFGPRARHDCAEAPPESRRNARALRNALAEAGFEPLDAEWWHFRDPASRDWPVLDVPFEEISR